MIRLVRNDIIISIKTSCFKRYLIYFAGLALSVVGTLWVLQNAMPAALQEALSYLGAEGEIDLGFISLGSLEDIRNLDLSKLIKISFSNNILLILLSFFAIENFNRSLNNGYFDFLISKRISRAKIYCSKIAVSFICTLIFFVEYIVCVVLMGIILFGMSVFIQMSIGSVLVIILKFMLGMLAFVSLFTMLMSLFRHSMSAIISCILMVVGMPVFTNFLGILTGNELWEYLWIGGCINNLQHSVLYGSLSAIAYTVLSLVFGIISFVKQDLK